MRHAHEHISRFVVAFLDEGFQSFGEGSIARLVSLHYFAHLLVYDQEVVVFVNYAGCYVCVIHCSAKIMTICQFSPGGTAFVIKKSVAPG